MIDNYDEINYVAYALVNGSGVFSALKLHNAVNYRNKRTKMSRLAPVFLGGVIRNFLKGRVIHF